MIWGCILKNLPFGALHKNDKLPACGRIGVNSVIVLPIKLSSFVSQDLLGRVNLIFSWLSVIKIQCSLIIAVVQKNNLCSCYIVTFYMMQDRRCSSLHQIIPWRWGCLGTNDWNPRHFTSECITTIYRFSVDGVPLYFIRKSRTIVSILQLE